MNKLEMSKQSKTIWRHRKSLLRTKQQQKSTIESYTSSQLIQAKYMAWQKRKSVPYVQALLISTFLKCIDSAQKPRWKLSMHRCCAPIHWMALDAKLNERVANAPRNMALQRSIEARDCSLIGLCDLGLRRVQFDQTGACTSITATRCSHRYAP